jgi:hypothetical protein
MPALPKHRPPSVPQVRALSGLSLPHLSAHVHHPDQQRVREDPSVSADNLLLLREIAKGESTAQLSRELGLGRKRLGELRQQIQTNLYDTLPGELMSGTTFEADELYQNAGEKYTASRSGRPAALARQ